MVEYIVMSILIALSAMAAVRYAGTQFGRRYECAAGAIAALPVADGTAAAAVGCASSDGGSAPLPSPISRFDDPSLGGLPLDHCLRFGSGCGKPAADAFCQSKGFSRSKSFGEELVRSTRTPTNELCDQSFAPERAPFCGRLTYVDCG